MWQSYVLLPLCKNIFENKHVYHQLMVLEKCGEAVFCVSYKCVLMSGNVCKGSVNGQMCHHVYIYSANFLRTFTDQCKHNILDLPYIYMSLNVWQNLMYFVIQ